LDGRLHSLDKLNAKDDKGRLVPLTQGGIKTIPSGLFPKNLPKFEPSESPTSSTVALESETPTHSIDEPSEEVEPEQSLNTITQDFQTLEVSPFMATTTLTTSTTTAPTHPLFPTTGSSSSAPNPVDPNDIMEQLRRALRQTPSSGGGGGGGGSGGGGGGGPAPAAQNPIAPAAAGDLKTVGQMPAIFDGDRVKADKFIEELKAYYRVNRDVAGFNSPIRKVALALTLMQGPQVRAWTRDVGDWIDGLGDQHNIPAVWDTFVTEFGLQFQDSQKAERAQTKLDALKMKWPDIDQYISDFDDLAREAGYGQDDGSLMRKFLSGLPKNVVQEVTRPPIATDYAATKRKAIEAITSQQLYEAITGARPQQQQQQTFRPSFQSRGNWNPWNNRRNPTFGGFNRQPDQQPRGNQPNRGQFNSSNAPRSYNSQPVPMDLDRTRAPYRGNRGNSQRANATQFGGQRQGQQGQRNNYGTNNNNRFECGRQGHFARDCPQRLAKQANLIDFEFPDNAPETVLPSDSVSNISSITDLSAHIRSLSGEDKKSLLSQLADPSDFTQA